MSNILLVTDSYPPEIRSASHLMLELAETLVQRGHQVTVVTCWPQYNLDPQIVQNFSESMNENGVHVLRLKHLPHHKVNFIVRGISQLTLPYLFIRKIKHIVKEKVDVVIVYSPPLPLSFVGIWAKKKWKAKFIVNVQDLFPKNAIDLGVLKNKMAIWFFNWMEKFSYHHADVITTHSVGNQTMLIQQYPAIKEKCITLHNWVDIDSHQAITMKNYRELFQLQDKFVMVFAGVIGPSQHLSLILNAALKVQDLSDLCFLIVGDGTDKIKLQEMVQDKKLNNIIFKPFINRDDYVALLKSCDVGLVSLSPKNKTPVVPGKILGYMAAGLPILACLNKESDGHELIREAGCGISVDSADPEKVVTAIREMYTKRHQTSIDGAAGSRYAREYFSKEKCVDVLEGYF